MSTELPDFTAAPAWQDGGGDVYINLCGLWDHWNDRAVDANDLRSWAPWTPLDTADEWVRRIDRERLAKVIELAPDPSHAGMGTRHVGMDWAREMADAVIAALPELMGGEQA